MSICPKCSAYYDDHSLAFCLADGAPLVQVDPGSRSWNEGTRSIEENKNSLRGQQRKRKWRRIWSSLAVALATIVLAYVLVARGFVGVEQVTPSRSPTPPPATTSSEPWPSPLPIPLSIPDLTPSPSPTREVPPSPSPTQIKITPPSPSPTQTKITPPSPSPFVIHETPTPPPPASPSPRISPSPTPCSETRETMIRRFGDMWRRRISDDPPKAAPGAQEKPILEWIEYQVSFKECKAAFITAKYEWVFRPNAVSSGRRVSGEKRFGCFKVVGIWVCN
ncbi:MAG: hypothetical protein JWM21_4064 [Acidobacteria bacterium]|nr:hypothetical protein [Acidobacteriota bacterium]